MSVRCITQVLDKSRHAGSELLMLVVLADYSDDDGNSYPSVASLARKCRMSPRNANYVLAALQDSGELRVLKNEGPKGTNRYRIMLSQLGGNPLQPASPLKGASPMQPVAPSTPAAGCTPEKDCTLKPVSAPPEAGFLKPLKPASDEPSLNRQEPSEEKAPRSRAPVFDASAIELPDWLDRALWARWVKHRRTIRKSLSDEGARLSVEKLERYRAQGYAPQDVIEHAIASGHQGLFPPPDRRRQPGSALSHAGFDSKDYSKGVRSDGYLE